MSAQLLRAKFSKAPKRNKHLSFGYIREIENMGINQTNPLMIKYLCFAYLNQDEDKFDRVKEGGKGNGIYEKSQNDKAIKIKCLSSRGGVWNEIWGLTVASQGEHVWTFKIIKFPVIWTKIGIESRNEKFGYSLNITKLAADKSQWISNDKCCEDKLNKINEKTRKYPNQSKHSINDGDTIKMTLNFDRYDLVFEWNDEFFLWEPVEKGQEYRMKIECQTVDYALYELLDYQMKY